MDLDNAIIVLDPGYKQLLCPAQVFEYLVRNGPLLASTIDEEYFASLSLIYTIFSIAILVCVELKYNTRSCPNYLLSL